MLAAVTEANLHRNEVVTEVLNGLTHGSGVIFGIGAIPVIQAL